MRRAGPALALALTWLVATTVGPTSEDVPTDLPVYAGYARALGGGFVPYRDFAVEYPPLALVPMGLGGIFGTDRTVYAWTFGALMLGAALAAQAAAARLAGPEHGRAVAWAMVALPVGLGAIVRTRFDLVPTALLLWGLVLVLARRPALAFGLLALGTATKLFPAVAAAVAFAWLLAAGRRREAVTGAVAFAGVLALVTLPFVVAAPAGFVDSFVFHVKRPVQIESTPATVLWALGDSFITGAPVRPDRFKSNGLAGGPDTLVAISLAIAQALALGAAVALAAARRPAGDPGRLVLAALAALVAFVALGKVLSPQYLVWLAPLALAAGGRRALVPAALVLLAAPLTQLEFPSRYYDLVDGDAEVVVLVGVRNAVLLAALSFALVRLAAPARSPVRVPDAPDRSG